jgi:hypothetical protein
VAVIVDAEIHDYRVVLKIVRPRIGVARIVRSRSRAAKVDTWSLIAVDRIWVNNIAAARGLVDQDAAPAVLGNYVACVLFGSADRVLRGTVRQQHAMRTVELHLAVLDQIADRLAPVDL